MSKKPILRAIGIKKTFVMGNERLDVLRGIDLEIDSGEIVAITGPSGSGKSTLLHILGTLDRPTEGEVYLDSIPLTDLGEKKVAELRNRTIGFVFQFHHLLSEFNVIENVAMPLLIRGENVEEAFPKAERLLIDVRLNQRMKHRPDELSGGEKQRVAVARALITQPLLVLADEPTGNLDSEGTRTLLELFKNLNREIRIAILVVTHSSGVARIAHKRFRLEEGRLA